MGLSLLSYLHRQIHGLHVMLSHLASGHFESFLPSKTNSMVWIVRCRRYAVSSSATRMAAVATSVALQ
ncbi:unnamed protein product [Ixodes persulcatus]